MSSRILFTTINGFEIIGDRVNLCNEDTQFAVKHPLIIRPVEKEPGKFMLDFFPHSLANPEGTHTFNRTSVLSFSEELPKELDEAYTRRTSNIIIASALDQMERM